MPKDYLEEPYAAVRRKDRAIDDDAWIVELLRRAPMAQLATVHDGQPFINSNLFAYDEAAHVVYMHTASAGRTRSNVEADERACVSISEMGRLLPSHEALSMSVEYGGVAIFGRACVVSNDAEKERGLRLILDKYFPHLNTASTTAPSRPTNWRAPASTASRSTRGAASASRPRRALPGAFRYGKRTVIVQRGEQSMPAVDHTRRATNESPTWDSICRHAPRPPARSDTRSEPAISSCCRATHLSAPMAA